MQTAPGLVTTDQQSEASAGSELPPASAQEHRVAHKDTEKGAEALLALLASGTQVSTGDAGQGRSESHAESHDA